MPVTDKDLEAVFGRYPTLTVPCSLGPWANGRKYHLTFSNRLEMDPYPVLPGHSRSKQYMGLHKCLFFTFQHPPVLSSLIRMASAIHTMKPWGTVTWVGRVSSRRGKENRGHGIVWPASLWTPPEPYRSKRQSFKCLIHPVRIVNSWKIVVVELPQFPRELFESFLSADSSSKP